MLSAAFRSFAAAGIALFAFDAHGFGKSRQAAPAPLYVQTIEHFIDDVYTFRQVSHNEALELSCAVPGLANHVDTVVQVERLCKDAFQLQTCLEKCAAICT